MGKIIKIVLIVLICLFSVTAFAEDINFIKKLDLSRSQVKKLRAQKIKTAKEVKKIEKELRIKEKLLEIELSVEDPDVESIKSITQEISQIKNKLLEQKVDSVMNMRKIMTKDQLNKLDQLSGKEEADVPSSNNKENAKTRLLNIMKKK